MENIKIVASGKYIPTKKVLNKELEEKLNLESGYIYKRTGIETRFYEENEKIEYMANKAIEDLQKKVDLQNTELIIVATTTTKKLMPAISNEIQKKLNIKKCICFDILAGCAGFINALDIATMYIKSGKVKNAIVVGVDILSKYTDKTDVGTAIILSDGAGAIYLEQNEKHKKYYSNIEAEVDEKQILTCISDKKIYMDGIEIYKYAVTKTVNNINELLKASNEKIENIKYIIPHQSNLKIIKSIASKLKIDMSKIYVNIKEVGNTFCASIPIAITEMQEKNLLNKGDKIILLGYGGGLNTGSILLEI